MWGCRLAGSWMLGNLGGLLQHGHVQLLSFQCSHSGNSLHGFTASVSSQRGTPRTATTPRLPGPQAWQRGSGVVAGSLRCPGVFYGPRGVATRGPHPPQDRHTSRELSHVSFETKRSRLLFFFLRRARDDNHFSRHGEDESPAAQHPLRARPKSKEFTKLQTSHGLKLEPNEPNGETPSSCVKTSRAHPCRNAQHLKHPQPQEARGARLDL